MGTVPYREIGLQLFAVSRHIYTQRHANAFKDSVHVACSAKGYYPLSTGYLIAL